MSNNKFKKKCINQCFSDKFRQWRTRDMSTSGGVQLTIIIFVPAFKYSLLPNRQINEKWYL